MTTSGVVRARHEPAARFAIALIPLAGVTLVATRYRQSWYLSDEWTIFERILGLHLLRSTFEVYNGHLYAIPILAYRAQLALGLRGHALIWIFFCLTLVACNLAVARILWVAGVPALAAMVAGAVITYFGPGAQLMTLEFQLGVVGAVALSFVAGSEALRRDSSVGSAVVIAGVLLVATAFDSGAASAGAAFVAVLLVLRWRDRRIFVALGPTLVVGAAVYVAARGSPRWPASIGTESALAGRLLLHAAGGLAGGGEVAGGFVLAAAGAVFIPALASRRVSRDARHCLAAGTVAALMMTGVIATTRGGLVGNDFVDADRYVGLVAIFLLVAILPAAVSVARDLAGRRAAWISVVTAVLLAITFVLNVAPLTHYRRLVEGYQTQDRAVVQQAYAQIARGCPGGQPAPAGANPIGPAYGPGVTVQFLRRLQSRGSLRFATNNVAISAAVRDATCGPPGHA